MRVVCVCVCVVWCCEVRKYKKKNKKHWRNYQNMVKFWHDMAIHEPQNGPKTDIFPNAFPLGFKDVFGRRVLFQTGKHAFLGPTYYSKGPNHALEKGPNQRNTRHCHKRVTAENAEDTS